VPTAQRGVLVLTNEGLACLQAMHHRDWRKAGDILYQVDSIHECPHRWKLGQLRTVTFSKISAQACREISVRYIETMQLPTDVSFRGTPHDRWCLWNYGIILTPPQE
jgi:hypothetical protein